jgi:hypothetical protein
MGGRRQVRQPQLLAALGAVLLELAEPLLNVGRKVGQIK